MRYHLAIAALAAALFPQTASAEATKIFVQGACPLVAGACAQIMPSSTFPLTVRTYAFNAPAAGRAVVMFEGSAQCVNEDDTDSASSGVIDLIAGILTGAETNPSISGRGANRYAFRLPPVSPNSADYSVPVNFSTSRVMDISSSGPVTVKFVVRNLRMDPQTLCNVLSGSFSVIFAPTL